VTNLDDHFDAPGLQVLTAVSDDDKSDAFGDDVEGKEERVG